MDWFQKFQFGKIDFSQKSAGHVTSIFRFLTHFLLRIWWYNRNAEIQTFRIKRNKVWIQPFYNRFGKLFCLEPSKMNSKSVYLLKNQIQKIKPPKDRKRLRNTSKNFKNVLFKFIEKLKNLNRPKLIGTMKIIVPI